MQSAQQKCLAETDRRLAGENPTVSYFFVARALFVFFFCLDGESIFN